MKQIIFFLLISFSAFSQIKHTTTDFYLSEKKVYWQHIYEVKDKDSIELRNYFEKEILLSLKLSDLQSIENTISFKISDDSVDFRKYGGKAMTTAFLSQLPLNYLVIIDFKNQKYRVTIKEIFLNDNRTGNNYLSGNLTEFCTKKKATIFNESNTITKGLEYNNNHFLEKFTIKEDPSLNQKW